MAVVKTPQESRIGIKVANGTSASGAAQYNRCSECKEWRQRNENKTA